MFGEDMLNECFLMKTKTEYTVRCLKQRIDLILNRKKDIYRLDCLKSAKRRIDNILSVIQGHYNFCSWSTAFIVETDYVVDEYGKNNLFFDIVINQKQINLNDFDEFDMESYKNGMLYIINLIVKFCKQSKDRLEEYRQFVYEKLGIAYK